MATGGAEQPRGRARGVGRGALALDGASLSIGAEGSDAWVKHAHMRTCNVHTWESAEHAWSRNVPTFSRMEKATQD